VSRRRPKPPPLARGETRSFTIKIACTDRGQHPRIVLRHIADYRGHGMDFGETLVLDGRNGSPVSSWREDGTVRYAFRCPRCKRNPQLREESLFKVIDALAELSTGNAHPTLDISLLPC
jgi:hypothetical protein